MKDQEIEKIATEGESIAWVSGAQVLTTKASLSFPAKVWWAIVCAQLRPTINCNTLSASLALLVVCLMVEYPVNMGRIIAIEMWDRPLNEREDQTQSIVNQIVLKLSQVVQRIVLATEKRLKYEMWTELPVLKNKMDRLEVHMNNQIQAEGSALDEIWGDVPKEKSRERKQKDVVSDEEQQTDFSKEERTHLKKARKESKRLARETSSLEQQRREAVLVSAFVSTIPDPVDNS
uniref:Putative plant transposon protein domain-containing protein n=1 Tax=Solanum tuberosum TaxID=4113 RepID=M1DJQ2_SOLTU